MGPDIETLRRAETDMCQMIEAHLLEPHTNVWSPSSVSFLWVDDEISELVGGNFSHGVSESLWILSLKTYNSDPAEITDDTATSARRFLRVAWIDGPKVV